MDKKTQVEKIRLFRDGLKKYLEVCNEVWRARSEYRSVEAGIYKMEKDTRESLTEEWGRLEQLFLKIGAPTHSHHPATGITRSLFDEALSADFEGSLKGTHLEGAIGAATKAIGLFDALSEPQYNSIQKTTPIIFIGHSFKDEHKEDIAKIIKFIGTFPVSVVTGEKPSLTGVAKGVPEKVKRLIDDADLVVAVLTKDEAISGNKATSSKWVSDEIAYSLGKEKIVFRLVENGVEYKPAISGDAEYLPFNKENLAEVFEKLSELLNSFLAH